MKKREDKDYVFRDWQYEVANNYTRLGYWEWVKNCRERDELEHRSIYGTTPGKDS